MKNGGETVVCPLGLLQAGVDMMKNNRSFRYEER